MRVGTEEKTGEIATDNEPEKESAKYNNEEVSAHVADAGNSMADACRGLETSTSKEKKEQDLKEKEQDLKEKENNKDKEHTKAEAGAEPEKTDGREQGPSPCEQGSSLETTAVADPSLPKYTDQPR